MGCCYSNLLRDAFVMRKYGLKIYEDFMSYDNFVRFQKQALDKEADSIYSCIPVVLHIDCKRNPFEIIRDILPNRIYTIECIRYGNFRIFKVCIEYNSY